MLRFALPTGDLRAPVAALLAQSGVGSDDYARGSRALRLQLAEHEDIALRVFREKDIPIQIALGNYDLGICSAAWVEELHARFPSEDVVLLRPLDFGRRKLVVAAAPETVRRFGHGAPWQSSGPVRIVSEYPGLAELLAARMRLARATVFGVWGAAEAYPPEDADLVLLSVEQESEVAAAGLEPLMTLMEAPAWLIANRRSLSQSDLGLTLVRLLNAGGRATGGRLTVPARLAVGPLSGVRQHAGQEFNLTEAATPRTDVVRLAIPDGHAQRHTVVALAAAGLNFDGYDETRFVRRPASGIDGLELKVIRPQDMPQQVAIGAFDLAVTGRDWLMDHLWAFPASPVEEVVDLKLSRYAIAAAVSEDVPAETLAGALTYWRGQGRTTIRVASEYPHMADYFARLRQLGRYQVVPVNGASEAFVPEDSEILIEGSETGSSFRANRLKAIDRLMESTNCVIARTAAVSGPRRRLIDRLVEQLRASVAAREE